MDAVCKIEILDRAIQLAKDDDIDAAGDLKTRIKQYYKALLALVED